MPKDICILEADGVLQSMPFMYFYLKYTTAYVEFKTWLITAIHFVHVSSSLKHTTSAYSFVLKAWQASSVANLWLDSSRFREGLSVGLSFTFFWVCIFLGRTYKTNLFFSRKRLWFSVLTKRNHTDLGLSLSKLMAHYYFSPQTTGANCGTRSRCWGIKNVKLSASSFSDVWGQSSRMVIERT